MELPEYLCQRRDEPEALSPTDRSWDGLPSMHLKETVTGSDPGPALATAVEAFWTERALYFRFTCKDDYVRATMTRRDDPIYKEDVVEVFLSPTGSLIEYKEFELSPRNVQFDAHIRNEGRVAVDTAWDAPGWRTEVFRAGEQGDWTCVWELPFAALRVGSPRPGDVWRMNCYRIDRGKDREDLYLAWSPTGAKNFHIPQRFGRLRFVQA